MGGAEVSVLIPVLDEERGLGRCAALMLDQDLPERAEFLFVDGGSQDATPRILAELAAADDRVRVLANPERLIPTALNVGLRAARGEFVARMDAHSEYPREYLRLGVERLRRGDVVSVSGPQIAVGDSGWSRRVALALQTPLGVGGARFRRASEAELEVDTGFTGMWRREVLVAAGGWDERWPTDEDCELAFRLTAHGGRHVCLPRMAAAYIPRGSVTALSRQYWRYGLHKVPTFRRHPAAMRPSHLLPPGLAAAVLAAVAAPRRLRRAARAGLGAYALALAVTAAQATRRSSATDAATLPAVLATMHLSYGFGLLAGAARHGVPAAAIAHAARRAAGRC